MVKSSPQLIVGLGNPGKGYEYTRHNFGFLAVARLAKEFGLKFSKSTSLKSFVAEGSIEGHDTCLLLPQTFMNNSGTAVQEAARRKSIAPENILVVCDDLNLDFGQFRLRPNGSDGGHNGLVSVIAHLASKEFARLRLGIGRPQSKEETVDFVLTNFSKEERKELPALLEEAVRCCAVWLTQGTAKAMNQFNQRKENE